MCSTNTRQSLTRRRRPAVQVWETFILTHLVPAPARGTEQEWIDQAEAHCNGSVVQATDLLAYWRST